MDSRLRGNDGGGGVLWMRGGMDSRLRGNDVDGGGNGVGGCGSDGGGGSLQTWTGAGVACRVWIERGAYPACGSALVWGVVYLWERVLGRGRI